MVRDENIFFLYKKKNLRLIHRFRRQLLSSKTIFISEFCSEISGFKKELSDWSVAADKVVSLLAQVLSVVVGVLFEDVGRLADVFHLGEDFLADSVFDVVGAVVLGRLEALLLLVQNLLVLLNRVQSV